MMDTLIPAMNAYNTSLEQGKDFAAALAVLKIASENGKESTRDLVAKIGKEYDAHQQQLFRDSLNAALTLSEVQELIDRVGLAQVKLSQSSDLHWTIERKRISIA